MVPNHCFWTTSAPLAVLKRFPKSINSELFMLKIKFGTKYEGIFNHFILRCSSNFERLGNTGLASFSPQTSSMYLFVKCDFGISCLLNFYCLIKFCYIKAPKKRAKTNFIQIKATCFKHVQILLYYSIQVTSVVWTNSRKQKYE